MEEASELVFVMGGCVGNMVVMYVVFVVNSYANQKYMKSSSCEYQKVRKYQEEIYHATDGAILVS